ncbi:anti-repressor SinI family protein [Alkalihalobacterium sp. APHAB7]|uniref:anti-repressor SinI family protein n=1 Tax=Alkalihalobacterium sp. APHAB7 TaxID=3402081 RepID=UPI003AAFF85C
MKSSGMVNLDHEWIELMKEAKNLGISTDEVKTFFLKTEKVAPTIHTSRTFKINKKTSSFYATL